MFPKNNFKEINSTSKSSTLLDSYIKYKKDMKTQLYNPTNKDPISQKISELYKEIINEKNKIDFFKMQEQEQSNFNQSKLSIDNKYTQFCEKLKENKKNKKLKDANNNDINLFFKYCCSSVNDLKSPKIYEISDFSNINYKYGKDKEQNHWSVGTTDKVYKFRNIVKEEFENK